MSLVRPNLPAQVQVCLEILSVGWSAENVAAEISIKQKSKPVRCPKTAANDGQRSRPEARAHNDVIIGLHVNVWLSTLADRGDIHSNFCLAVLADDADEVNFLRNCNRGKAAGRVNEAT